MHDLVIVSDFHIGRGKNPLTGRYHSLETYFYDDDWRRFCRHLVEDAKARDAKVRLVFNGDTFDFIRIDPECYPDSSRRERRFGADLSPELAANVIRDILSGHPVFVDALADLLEAGHEIVFLPGNHDIEVAWVPVQQVIRDALAAVVRRRQGEAGAAAALAGLVFKPWFHYEPGRVWVEHGCQYDPECAFRYPLRKDLPALEDPKDLELDMPLGNFFQKYLYNAFGPMTFIVPSSRANTRYMRWLLLHEPRLLARVIASHVPFIVQMLRRLKEKGIGATKVLAETQEAALAELARSSGLGDTLRQIDAMKNVHGDLLHAARGYGWQALKVLLMSQVVALGCAGIWSTGTLAISELQSGFGLKSALFLLMNFGMLAAIGGTLAWWLLRSTPEVEPWPLRQGAQKIVDLLDVPVVTFGHTHDETIWTLQRPGGALGWYYNTGTWIAVFTHDVLMPRERVQFTFLRVRGTQPELLHWSPGRAEPLSVVLLDEPVASGRQQVPVHGAEPAS